MLEMNLICWPRAGEAKCNASDTVKHKHIASRWFSLNRVRKTSNINEQDYDGSNQLATRMNLYLALKLLMPNNEIGRKFQTVPLVNGGFQSASSFEGIDLFSTMEWA